MLKRGRAQRRIKADVEPLPRLPVLLVLSSYNVLAASLLQGQETSLRGARRRMLSLGTQKELSLTSVQ